MDKILVKYLVCPQCKHQLKLQPFELENEEFMEGLLICKGEQCGAWYPITRGIPRMLPENLRLELTNEFVKRFKTQFDSLSLGYEFELPEDELKELKQETIKNFGHEWLEYSRFGWDDPQYDITSEENVFLHKSLLAASEIKDKFVLDAGCGNGRYSYWASVYGGRVIGMDLGDGVESAYKNTRNLSNTHIVQGDIFNPPFKRIFDVIYSIGVLMHTGNAQKATTSLSELLKPNGSLTAHVYGKGNTVYEYIDASLRNRTTRMSIDNLSQLTKRLYSASNVLKRLRLLRLVNVFMRLEDHPHCIFDWYAAPIATHHTYDEVKKWCDEMGLRVLATNEKIPQTLSQRVKDILRSRHSVTVRAISAGALIDGEN